MKRELLRTGDVLERVYDHAAWWAIDMGVGIGDLFEYVGLDKHIHDGNELVKVRPLNKYIRKSHWTIRMTHFINQDGTIAKAGQCIWK